MRSIKMFGMAAIAAVAAMAIVGATSAMAESTSLCESDPAELSCATGTEASHVHFSTLTGEKAILLSSVVNFKCDILYLGDDLALAAPLTIHGSFVYSNCNTESGGKCTLSEVSLNALLSVLKTAEELGEVTFKYEVLMECSGFIHCVYNSVGLQAHALGSLGNGHVTITKQTVNKVNGFLCPKTATLDILIGPLEPLYIRN